MSVEQEAGDLIACVATGSTTRGRLNKWIAELGLPSAEKNGFVLQSFDEDESGDAGADYWIQNLKRCMRWSPYVAKDPNDILRGKFLPDTEERHYSGYTLREWVEAGIHIAKVEFGQSRPFVLPPSGGVASVPTIPLARGESKRKDFPVDLSKTKWHGPEVDMKAISIQEWKKNSLPRMEQGKQKDRFPPWLITGTDDWKKLVKRVGLEEVNERRQVALSELN
jgi:hypothetical protein